MDEIENVRVAVRPRPLTTHEVVDGVEVVMEIQQCQEQTKETDSSAPGQLMLHTPRRPVSGHEGCDAPQQKFTLPSLTPATRRTRSVRAEIIGQAAAEKEERLSGETDRTFTFDRIYSPSATQRDVFEDVVPYVDAAIEGYNSTVFCYGPTGAGKTYTMCGPEDNPGLLTRALKRIFDSVANQADRLFVVQMSFVELYNDKFIDLLDPANQPQQKKKQVPAYVQSSIRIRQDGNKQIFLTGSKHLRSNVTTITQARTLTRHGLRARATGETLLNDHSSRSHTIMTIHVESRDAKNAAAPTRLGKLHLVDLAGSERLDRSGVVGNAQRETQNINKSLSALSDVLGALSSDDYNGPVPYRNSKLTRLLQDSLGGNSKTFFIISTHMTAPSYHETLLALSYGARAKKIKNITSLNEDAQQDSDVSVLSREIDELRKRLRERSDRFDHLSQQHATTETEKRTLQRQLDELALQHTAEQKRVELATSKLAEQQNNELSLTAELKYDYSTLQRSMDDYRDQIHSLRVQLQLAVNDKDDLQDALASREHTIQVLRDEIQELDDLLASKDQDGTEAESEWRAEVAKLESARAAAEKDAAASLARAEKLEEQLTLSKSQTTALTEQLDIKSAELERREGQVGKLRDKLRELKPLIEQHEALGLTFLAAPAPEKSTGGRKRTSAAAPQTSKTKRKSSEGTDHASMAPKKSAPKKKRQKSESATFEKPALHDSSNGASPSTKNGASKKPGRTFFNAEQNDLSAEPGSPTAPIRIRANRWNLFKAQPAGGMAVPKMKS